ncbi:MAG: DUF4190 domain-containing protein [Actinomycetota bacterium]|nr:DUF4190 domain-containing protein [Actinomycetota bacterium]
MSNVPPPPDQSGWSNPPQSQPGPEYGGQPGYGGQAGGAQGGYGQPQRQPSNGIGIAALVVGIISLVISWVPFLGLLLAIVAIVLGVLGIRKASRGEATNKGMAITGVVTGGLALLVGAFITISTIVLLGSDEFQDFTDKFQNLSECSAEAQTAEEQEACQREFEEGFPQ